jgi:cyclase
MKNEKCNITRIGGRGTLFTFHELAGLETNVYVINGPKHVFVVDTFLGTRSMDVVKKRMAGALRRKPVVVVNTHYHWDHVWGNCAFPGALVVSHARCRETMLRIGKKELAAYAALRQGKVELVYPDCTFTGRLMFEDDGVELFHSPGHSPDSISVYDRTDRVLLVGDNVEEPLPFLYSLDLEHFKQTLEAYLALKAKRIIAGHCSQVTPGLIKRNMGYLRAFRLGRTGRFEKDPYRQTHAQNRLAMKTMRNK